MMLKFSFVSALGLAIATFSTAALAQSITAAPDGTDTVITIEGNTYHIEGGTQAGANLFHSFQDFGLSSHEIANFLSNPSIVHILGRITGGNPSTIDGLIQITGANSNLYLMNPAGIVFGAGASLNIGGDFLATTADGIGFAGGWFNASGENDYSALVDTPSQFAFDRINPGSIVNGGNLATAGNLTLLAGEVVQTGALTANTVTLQAIPDSGWVRISQPEHLLSLEILPPRDAQGEVSAIAPLDLPTLLTGQGDWGDLPITTGTTVAAGAIAATEVNLLGERVAVLDTITTPINGTVRIGGDYLGAGTIPNAQQTYVSLEAEITAEQGRVIVWSDEATRFFGTVNVAGGFVETSSKDYLEVSGSTVIADHWLLDPRNVTISSTTSGGSFSGSNPNVFTPTTDNATINVADILNSLSTGSNVTITTGTTGNQDGNITVSSEIDATALTGAQTLTLDAANNIVVNADIKNSDPSVSRALSVVFLAGGNIDVNATITTGGGSITMTSGGNLTTTNGTLNSAESTASSVDVQGGTVQLTAGGSLAAGAISTSTFTNQQDAVSGDVTLTAEASLVVSSINTSATTLEGNAKGGDVTLTAGEDITADLSQINVQADSTGTGTTTNGIITINANTRETEEELSCVLNCTPTNSLISPTPEGLDSGTSLLDTAAEETEAQITKDYAELGDEETTEPVTISETQEILNNIQQQTGSKPALVYFDFIPSAIAQQRPTSPLIASRATRFGNLSSQAITDANQHDELQIILVTTQGNPIVLRSPGITRQLINDHVRRFRRGINRPNSQRYLDSAQQLYDWLITPLEPHLQQEGIDNLSIIAAEGLRSLPIGALHSGEQFLIEQYSVGLVPSLSLIDWSYQPLHHAQVLAMGASEFTNQTPLPAVPTELALITEQRSGAQYLNEQFTYANLQAQNQEREFQILHLATHAEFNRNSPKDAYVQLWGDDTLQLKDLRKLKFYEEPTVELLVLSACQTALGSTKAELGFAGAALQAGVKSVLASLWTVSDVGTVVLMDEFYRQLANPNVTTKAEALRQAQLALLQDTTGVRHNAWGELDGTGNFGGDRAPDFTHPYYWSAFTLVGSPW